MTGHPTRRSPGGTEEGLRVKRAIAVVWVVVWPLAAAGQPDTAKADAKAAAKPKDVAADINAPRPDAHKVHFEVDEGTWLSLDVSPDRQTLVFHLLGDLYTL